MARTFNILINTGTSPGPYSVFYDAILPSNYAIRVSTGLNAVNISYTDLTTPPGVAVTVPDTATYIILYNSLCGNNQTFTVPGTTPSPTSTVTPTTTPTPTTTLCLTYNFCPNAQLTWPTTQDGYTLYTSGFTSIDDGNTISPIVLPSSFAANGTSSTNLYVSTNGYITLGLGAGNIIYSPQQLSSPAAMAANPGDNWLNPGNLTNDDGDLQNLYFTTGNDNGGRYYAKILVYGGIYGSTELNKVPTSWIANFYKDCQYEWFETFIKDTSTVRGNAGPYNATDVSQIASQSSQVWRGDLNGQTSS